MKKSAWKLNFIHPMFYKSKIYKKSSIGLSNFRNSSVVSPLVGKKVYIYNGAWKLTKKFENVHVGFKIGEFSKTKEFDRQTQTKQKTKRKK